MLVNGPIPLESLDESNRLTLRQETLDGDCRLTFVIDLDADHALENDHTIRPAFANAAIKLRTTSWTI